jgi:TetR/AcrR family transcriptional regulator, transcriptional repressor for nem operon
MCLVVKLSMEVSSWSEPMRAVLASAYDEWLGIYEELITEGQKKGHIATHTPAQALAEMVYDLWFGAMIRSVIIKSSQPLQRAVEAVNARLLP